MLDDLIKSHDVVVSLLPWTLHPTIAKHAIANNTNMVTASYLSPGLMDQHASAVEAGVTVVNECGVDPGGLNFNTRSLEYIPSLFYNRNRSFPGNGVFR